MSKGNCTKGPDGSLLYTAVTKSGAAPKLESEKWYVEKCEIPGYETEHLTIKINADGIIRVDGNYKGEKASKSFFKEYIIPDGVDYEALEFGIYEADKNTLVIVGAIGGGEMVPAPAPAPVAAAPPPPPPPAAMSQQQTSTKITRTENVKISSKFTETFESSELDGSEDMSKEIRVADKEFEAKVNVSEYKTEEINVKISRKVVLIYTSRKEVTTTSTRKEIRKTFVIPAGVKPESITSVVDKEGNLTISAPVDEELAKQQHQQQQVEQQKTTTATTTTATTQQTNTNQTTQQEQQQVAVVQPSPQQTTTTTTQVCKADEVLLRTRTLNTVKNVTGQDLQGVKIEKDRFEMNVDLREYKLEEVSVKIVKTRRVVTISANHKSQFESRSTYREFTLPAGAPDSNPDAVDCVLSSNGILSISGPCSPQPSALTDITNAMVKSTKQDNQQLQQQQQVVQQQQQSQTQTQSQEVQEHQQHQSVQKSSYTKVTRKTFTSSTMTQLNVTGTDDDAEPQPEPGTPVEDVSEEMVEDEDGNLIVQLNVKDYRAEDIKVKVSKATITVSGRKTEEIKEDNKTITRIRQFCKKIRIPADVLVTPDSITSNLDTAEGVLVIMIVRSKVTKQITQQQDQKQIESTQHQQVQQQQQQQKQVESVQQQQTQQRQVESTQQQTQTSQQTTQVTQSVQQQQQATQQTTQSVQQTQATQQTTQSVEQQQQKQVESVQQQQQLQQRTESVDQQKQIQHQQQQNVDQQRQQVQQVDSSQTQGQKSTTSTTTTSKRTLKTSFTTTETLQKQGYNFESATTQVYTGDPKFFERATPIADYKPEELEVKIAAPWVIIEGKQEMSAENGWRSKQFTKMFTVPEGVKPENIHLELNDAGDVVNCTAPIG